MSPEISLDPTPRCCTSHPDWATLAAHLLAEFPQAQADQVLAELMRAREATNWIGLPATEALEMTEVTARYQLLLLTGRAVDIARLDPERHTGWAAPP